MHIERPATDQSLDLIVLVNNEAATEYVLPNSSSSSDGYIDTYLAVQAGDRLTVKWTFNGSVLHGNFDLVADGTLCRESRIEGDSAFGGLKNVKRTATWSTGLDCPKPEGWTSKEPSPQLFEGELVVAESTELKEHPEIGGGDRPGVGSLVVVVSVNQRTSENYHDPEKSIEMGSWRARAGEEVRQAEIPPEYVLELRLLDDDKIGSKRSLLHRKVWQATRFGNKPWGKLCFYYRSLDCIQRAGGIVRGKDEVLQVEAWDGEQDFVFVEPAKRGGSKRNSVANAGDHKEEDDMFVSGYTPERNIKQERQESVERAVTPLPKKKAKLGGALFGSAEKPQHDIPAAPTDIVDAEENRSSNSDVEPSSAELAAAPDYDVFDNDALDMGFNNSAEWLEHFDKKASKASKFVSIDDAAPSWTWPKATPPARKVNEASESAGKANIAIVTPSNPARSFSAESPPLRTASIHNQATMPNSAALEPADVLRVPTIREINNIVHPTGTPLSVIDKLFRNNGPFAQTEVARAVFNERISKVMEKKSDGKYYLLPNEDISRAEMARAEMARVCSHAASRKGKKAGAKPKSTARSSLREDSQPEPLNEAVAKTKASSMSPVYEEVTPEPLKKAGAKTKASTVSSVYEDYEPEPLRYPDASPRPSAPRKRKLHTQLTSSGLTTSTAQDFKRAPTESSTPGAGINTAAARKQKLAWLKKELAVKSAREKQLRQQADQKAELEEAEIRKYEKQLEEADQRLRDLEEMQDEGGEIAGEEEYDDEEMEEEGEGA